MSTKTGAKWTDALLQSEVRAGILTVAFALIAVWWANSPLADSYDDFIHTTVSVGPLSLNVHHWAADFFLAFFFLVVGIELRHEFVSGSLRSWRNAAIPVVSAIGGIVVPASIYLILNVGTDTVRGWAIPAATDIAFALAVLALVAPKAPPALRLFLLTLAVVDDLGAISIIAIAYSDSVNLLWLLAAGLSIAFFAALQRTVLAHPATLIAIGFFTWFAVYTAGVHPTIAGVALGLALSDKGKFHPKLAKRTMAFFHPISTYFAVPLFVLVSTGISIEVFTPEIVSSPVFIGIIAGLVVGKPLGIVGFAWLSERVLGARRDSSLSWPHITLAGCVASIGFTVALLINDLAFGDTTTGRIAIASIAVAALIAAAISFVVARRIAR